MQDLNDLYFFAKVVEKGGFAAASRVLDVPKSRLSRRVALLEDSLGARLLQRTTRKLSLTDVGARYYEQCLVMLQAADAAEAVVLSHQSQPRGRLRISCPIGIAQFEIGPLLPAFSRAYPDVRVEMVVTNRRVDLIEEGIDIAFRVRAYGEEDPNLATRHLRRSETRIVGAPALLAKHPPIITPEDLRRVPMLIFGVDEASRTLSLTGPDGEFRAIKINPVFCADDFPALIYAALEGVGVVAFPDTYCLKELASGALLPVLPQWQFAARNLHCAYPSHKGLSPAVRAFIDFVAGPLSRSETAPESVDCRAHIATPVAPSSPS